MPKGELFFKLPAEALWEDAFDEYGISLTDGSLSKLMTPAPNKEAVQNKSRLQHGKRVTREDTYTRKDDRDVSLEMHITAPDKTAFWRRYNAFCNKYLDYGFIDIKHRDIEQKVFRMTYLDCQQFSQFHQQLAKYTLRLNEPDPMNRGETDSWESEDEE